MQKTYTLLRPNGRAECLIQASGFKRLLEPHESQKIRNHSPDGFEFGYAGSGPAQLALAILLDHTRDPEKAQRYYQDFKNDFIATAQPGDTITSEAIDQWLFNRS